MVDGHNDSAAAQRGQRPDHESASVAALHAHALAVGHPQLGKLAAQGFDLTPERLVIYRAGGVDYGDPVRPLAGGVGESVVNVHSDLDLKLAPFACEWFPPPPRMAGPALVRRRRRSEEHTSELQSLR